MDVTSTAMMASSALPASRQPPAIEVRGLCKSYGARTVLNKASLTIYQGDIYGLLGLNGAGKTTFISILLGLVRADAGNWYILGHDPRRRQDILQRIGAIIESPAFYPYLSTSENLAILGGLHSPIPSQRIDEVLTQVGLRNQARDRYRTFSLGMKQRLAIALALVNDPDILILDEPMNGLDPRGRVEMRELFRSLARTGKTILLCSHVLAEVEQVCNRMAILHHGHVIVEGDIGEVTGQHNLEQLFLQLTEENEE